MKWYQKKRVWAAIVAAIVAGVNSYYGWELNPAEIMEMISPFLP